MEQAALQEAPQPVTGLGAGQASEALNQVAGNGRSRATACSAHSKVLVQIRGKKLVPPFAACSRKIAAARSPDAG